MIHSPITFTKAIPIHNNAASFPQMVCCENLPPCNCPNKKRHTTWSLHTPNTIPRKSNRARSPQCTIKGFYIKSPFNPKPRLILSPPSIGLKDSNVWVKAPTNSISHSLKPRWNRIVQTCYITNLIKPCTMLVDTYGSSNHTNIHPYLDKKTIQLYMFNSLMEH